MDTHRLLLVAAAEPVGERACSGRAATGSGSASTRWTAPKPPACCIWGAGPLPSPAGALGGLPRGGSVTNGGRRTVHSPKPQIRPSTPIGEPGTAPSATRSGRGGRRGARAVRRPGPRARGLPRPPPSCARAMLTPTPPGGRRGRWPRVGDIRRRRPRPGARAPRRQRRRARSTISSGPEWCGSALGSPSRGGVGATPR